MTHLPMLARMNKNDFGNPHTGFPANSGVKPAKSGKFAKSGNRESSNRNRMIGQFSRFAANLVSNSGKSEKSLSITGYWMRLQIMGSPPLPTGGVTAKTRYPIPGLGSRFWVGITTPNFTTGTGDGVGLPGQNAATLTTPPQEVDMAGTTLPHKGTIREGSILTLDLGTKTGWALKQTDGTITSGTVEFRPGRFEGGGMAFLRFKKWLDEVRSFAAPIEGVWFEEVCAHAGVHAAHAYGGFLAHLTAWAEQHEIPYPIFAAFLTL